MKSIPAIPVAALRRTLAPVTITAAVLSAVLLGCVSAFGQTFSNINWVASSPADFSAAVDWDQGFVPTGSSFGSTNTYSAIFTNGVECDYASPDNYIVGQMSLGAWNSSSGSFVLNSGTLTVTTNNNNYSVSIGGRTGANGSGGSAESPNSGAGSTGTFTMNGGTLNVIRFGNGHYHQDSFILAIGTNSTGTFTLNGGNLNTYCGVEIGLYGAGTFTINGGTMVDDGWFGIGRGNGVPFGSGTFNMESGALYQMENTGGGTVGGTGGIALDQGCTNATVNMSGGSVYSGDIAFTGTSMTPRPMDYFNMVGGSFYIGYAGVNSNGGSVFVPSVNISGGTFHTVFMVPTTSGVLSQNGSTTNVIAGVGTNWTWSVNPPVNLTNSSFVVNGVSGPGYVTFAPEATRTITLNNPWSGVGGFVINGPGTVAMGGANTYTGGTTISQGNLTFNTGGSIVDPTLNVPSGSVLTFNTTGATTFTNVVTGAGNIVLANSGVVNLGSNIQNTGTVSQNNGILVLSGTISVPASITNSGPASVGPLLLQGDVQSPIGIGTNSSLEMGSAIQPGTAFASNVVLNGTWIEKLNTATTVGGGVNDLLICSNLTLNPSSALLITPETAPSAGSYIIAEYSGTLTGNFGALNNGTADSMTVSTNTPGEIILNVTSVNQSSLVWAATNFNANVNWDVNTTSNWTNSATSALSTFHQQDAVTFNAVPGTGVTNRVAVTGQIMPSSINISGGLPYLIAGTGYISGSTGINYNDTNTSGIYTGGNNYTGPVNINNGVLQLGVGGSSWLGTTNGATYVNGGTLDLNAQGVGAEPLVIQGTGSPMSGTNGGAINNSASTSPGQSAGPLNITLAGNTTLNASGNRWDIGVATLGAGGGSFAGNGYNLAKTGNQAIWMHEVGDIGVGNIDIQQGLLGFQYTIGMGIPLDTITVESGATLGLFQVVSNLNKQMVLNGNATLSSGGGTGSSNNFVGPITLNGTNTIATSSFPLNLPGNIAGTGGFILTGTGPLYLGGNDTYSGPTLMGPNSTLALETTIPNTPLIYMSPGSNTVIDASGAGSITLNRGQTLEGSGTIIGNFTANSGSTIFSGTNATTYGTIVFTNNLTLNGDTNDLKISDNANVGIDNDLIQVNGTLTLNGKSTIMVSPLAALNSDAPYTVIQAGSITGTAGNLTVVSESPRYTMTPAINGSQVQINIMGNAAPLEWEGYLTPNWDLVTSNWYNMGTATHDHFYIGDNPTFDDTASVTGVVVTNNVIVSGMNMSNVVKSYTFSGGGVISGPLNMEGNGNGTGGTTVLAMSNAPAFTTIDASAGTLVYNVPGVTNYTVAATIIDNFGNQGGTIIFGGSNTVTLTGTNDPAPVILGGYNPDFDGTIWVTNGILQYNNIGALGVDASVNGSTSFSPLIVTNNGTLNFNGIAAGSANGAAVGGEKWFHISGHGFNGQGAIMDSGNNAEPSGAYTYLYFDGDATIHMASTRCDQHVLSGNAQQVEGNGFNLTFTGGGAFFFNPQSDGDTHLGNIDVASTNGGRLAFQGGPLALGVTTNYLFVEPGGEVTFYNFSNNLDSVHLGVQKNIWLKGNAWIDSGGNAGTESNNFSCPIFLTGTNLIGVRYDMHVWGSIMDSNSPGGLVLGNDSVGASGASAGLYLDGANTYSGATIVSNAILHVGAGSSLGQSAYVQVNSGALLDLSAPPGYSFGSGQTMAGNGTVLGPASGTLDFNAGSALAIGLPDGNGARNTNTFALAISNNVALNAGSTDYVVANKTSAAAGAVPVDKLSGPTSLALGGTLVITNYGRNFVGGDSLALFSATGISTNGGYNILPATPGPGLAWDITSIPVNGTLKVVATVNLSPTKIGFAVSGNQLTLSWPADHTGWELEIQTNSLSVGINTNWVPDPASTTGDSVVIPINLANGTVFYRLVYPPQ